MNHQASKIVALTPFVFGVILAISTGIFFAAMKAEGAPDPAPLFAEHFDELQDGALNGQANWKVTGGDATVQPFAGHGKVAGIAFPFASASVGLPATTSLDQFTVQFSLRFTTKPENGDKASQKLIVFITDPAGKTLAQIWHDGNGQWGVRPGPGYRQSNLPNSTSDWTTVLITFDQKAKTYSLTLTNGQTTTLLFDSVAYTDPTAQTLGSISFARNGQGDDGLCLVDDVIVSPTVTKTADRLNAWVRSAPRLNIVPAGSQIVLHVHADRITMADADRLDWTVVNYLGGTVKRGSIPVPAGAGVWDSNIDLGSSLPSGYYALKGEFEKQGLDFEASGSRPENTVAFGVLPKLLALPLKHADDSRFGMQGTTFLQTGQRLVGDPYDPLYLALGARWVNFPAMWDQLEPDHPGQFDPAQSKALGGEMEYAAQNGMTYLTTTQGVPRWAMAVPPMVQPANLSNKIDSQAYPPASSDQFEDFMTRDAEHMDQIRRAYFPGMAHNWYQISWEPDWHWKGTARQYVDMVAEEYAAIHRGDPSAEVMGPGTGVFDKTVEWLKTMLPMGLGNSLDGIATHAYYLGEGDPAHPPLPGQIFAPEDQKVIQDMREVKSLTKQYLKPGARIIQSEWGLDYKGSYALVTPQLLQTLAAYTVRGHIILLGEGANTTYFFYTSDYAGEEGFGMTFNLTMPNPEFGAVEVAPKPQFMACAAMTRVLEGTTTIGPVSGLPADVYAYAFDRAGKTVVALWKAHGSPCAVSLPMDNQPCDVIDFMGNEEHRNTNHGHLTVEASAYPIYIDGVSRKAIAIATIR